MEFDQGPNKYGIRREIYTEIRKALLFFPENLLKQLESFIHVPKYEYVAGSEDPEITGTKRERSKKIHTILNWFPKELTQLIISADGSPFYIINIKTKLYIPLPFWFHNTELALPSIALPDLSYRHVEINFEHPSMV